MWAASSRAADDADAQLKLLTKELVDVAKLAAFAREKLGVVHYWVNNAGINKNSAAEDTPIAEFDATFNVNTRGVFMCCQHEARRAHIAG